MVNHPVSPFHLLQTLWQHRQLIADLAKRDALGKYRGSALGIFWSVLTPILMLSIYTFVFSEIFQSRWTAESSSKTEFAIVLFAGLIMFNVFSETVTRAPALILSNTNFVKKVIFPLEILPCVNLLSALFHMCTNLLVLLAFEFAVFGKLPGTAFLLPFILMPLAFFCLGVTWLLSALGVYLRDIGQTISILVTGMMFLSPIFFPLSLVPAAWRPIAQLNPLVFPIEQARNVLIWGKVPDLLEWFFYTAAAVVVAWIGFACFQKTRKGFADVL